MIHASINPGAQITLPWNTAYNALAYVLSGSGTAGAAQPRPVHLGQLALFGPGSSITLRADDKQETRSPNLEVVLLGGLPIGEPVAHYGPFVMNSHAELVQAVEDFQAGRMGRIPAGQI